MVSPGGYILGAHILFLLLYVLIHYLLSWKFNFSCKQLKQNYLWHIYTYLDGSFVPSCLLSILQKGRAIGAMSYEAISFSYRT